ncbi:MAG: amidohydrolase family protein [Rhizobiaceae bacterium]|nr:amidohydrolase family protein [Rhizobiaceae bacterium]
MRIVDPHVHLWNLSSGLYPGLEKPSTGFIGNNAPIARSYLLDELLAEGHDAFEIAKIVNVEAFPTRPLDETILLQQLADRTGFPQAIVAAADLADAGCESLLASHAERRNVRGIRQVLNTHADPFYAYVAEDFLGNPAWRRNFGLLRRWNLSFDLQLYPQQMRAAAELAAAYPDVQIVLNHAGMFVDRTLAGWRQWRDGLALLAAHENVAVKISGLGMFDHGWTLESLRPYILTTLDAFGLRRAMFASNFPVDKLFGSYTDLWHAFSAAVADMSDDERAALFRTNAERIYRI